MPRRAPALLCTRPNHWAALLLTAALVACGGGSGGGATPTTNSGGGAVEVILDPGADNGTINLTAALTGGLWVLNEDGSTAAASAGHEVQLVSLDALGRPGAVLASTRTDASGRYVLPLPAGRTPGLDLGLVADDGAGGLWRAVALNADTEIGPGSEAATAELFDALGAQDGSAAGIRLGLFYRNASLVLTLQDPGRSTPAAAVARLRERLRADPDAAAALQALRSGGGLPATLGDIGALFGYTARAIELLDSDEGLRQELAQPVSGSPGAWTLSDTSVATPQDSNQARLQLEADGVTQQSLQTSDAETQLLLGLLGPYRIESFQLPMGVELTLAQRNAPTTGLDFSGDNIEDRYQFSQRQKVLGIEPIDALGRRWRALKVETVTELQILMSNGGSASTRSQVQRWLVPQLGAVHTVFNVVAQGRDGQTSTLAGTRVPGRAVAAETSWPGGVHLDATPAPTPSNLSFPRTLGLTADEQLTIEGGVFLQCCTGHLGLALRPLAAPAVSAELLVDPGALGSRAYLSPDGTRLYVTTSQAVPENGSFVTALPMDQAAALGATIVRYDARTLREEARFQLPPIPSVRQPGLGFPRMTVRSMLVSPLDPTHFVATGVDAVLMRGTSAAALALGGGIDNEQPLTGNSLRMLTDQVRLLGWDADRNELRVEINGGGPLSRAVPVTAAGLVASAQRDSVPVLFNLNTGFLNLDAMYDRVDARRIYLNGYRAVHDADTGTLLGDLSQQADLALRGAGCTLRGEAVACLTGEHLYLLDATTLAVQRQLPLQGDLRRQIGAHLVSSPQRLDLGRDGSLVFLGNDARPFPNNSGDTQAFRLSFE